MIRRVLLVTGGLLAIAYAVFLAQLTAIPYVLHDLLLTILVHLLGTAAGGAAFTIIVFLSLPVALLVYMRATGISSRVQLPVFLLSLLLATDWFFLVGFFAFRLAVAMVIASLAVVEVLRRRWSARVYVAYLAMVAAGFLVHLAAPVFLLVAVGTAAGVRLLFRSSTLKQEVLLVLPPAVLIVLNAAWPHADHTQYVFDRGASLHSRSSRTWLSRSPSSPSTCFCRATTRTPRTWIFGRW